MILMESVAIVLGIAALAIQSLASADDHIQIINGTDAKLGQFPHQVSLRDQYDWHFCGGSIINSRWILTAAHCVAYRLSFYAISGAIELAEPGSKHQIQQVYIHPGFKPHEHMKNDIALLRTVEEMIFNELVQPIALPSRNTSEYAPLTVAGWGASVYPPINPEEGQTNHLQFLHTQAISVRRCKKAYKDYSSVYDNNDFSLLVCTQPGNTGSCIGDDGGPLITRDNVLVGIVSWGVGCAQGFPDAATRVFAYINYIDEIIDHNLDDSENI